MGSSFIKEKESGNPLVLHIGVLSSVEMDTIQRGVSEHHYPALLILIAVYAFFLRETPVAQQTKVYRVLSSDYAGLRRALPDLLFHDRHHRRVRA